jgi:uncharacterized membrane protein (DUF373 family)
MKKFIDIMGEICDVIELILSVLVGIAAVAAMIYILPNIFGIIGGGVNADGLTEILEEVFTVVIAVEFLKMLLKPTSLTVIEVLIFLIARHMILQETTPAQDLMSVIGICLLLAAKLIIGHYKKYQTLPGIGRRAEETKPEEKMPVETRPEGTRPEEARTEENGSVSREEQVSRGIEQAEAADPAVSVAPNQPERVGHGPVDRRTYHDVVRELDTNSDKKAPDQG